MLNLNIVPIDYVQNLKICSYLFNTLSHAFDTYVYNKKTFYKGFIITFSCFSNKYKKFGTNFSNSLQIRI